MGRAIRWVLIALMVFGAAAGCGGAAVETTPGVPGNQRRALTDLDALEHDLDVSEQRLLASLEQQRAKHEQPPAAAPTAPTGGAAPAPAEAEPPPAQAAPPADKESAFSASESGEPRAGTPCDIACRAFASMRRSAERICELAGQSDGRCTRARQRVEEAQSRIARASCRCLHED